MKASEILNGHIEQDILDGLASIQTAIDGKPYMAKISISVSTGDDGYVCAAIETLDRSLDIGAAYGCKDIPSAVAETLKSAFGEKSVEARRAKIAQKIEELEKELETLPQVQEPVIIDPTACPSCVSQS